MIYIDSLEVLRLEGRRSLLAYAARGELDRIGHQLVVQACVLLVLIIDGVPQVFDGAPVIVIISRLYLELARGYTTGMQLILDISGRAATLLKMGAARRLPLPWVLCVAHAPQT